jgi:hypothetical protein
MSAPTATVRAYCTADTKLKARRAGAVPLLHALCVRPDREWCGKQPRPHRSERGCEHHAERD